MVFPNNIKMIEKEYWTVAYTQLGSQSWTELDALAIPCTYTTSNVNDNLTLTVTRTAPQGELVVTYKKPAAEPLKIDASFTNTNDAWTNHKFRFVEKFIDISIDEIDINETTHKDFSNGYSNFFSWDNIPDKLIIFSKSNLAPFVFNVEQGYDDFQGVQVDYNAGQLDMSLVFGRGQNFLLPNETMTIDPTFGFTAGTTDRIATNSATGATCPSTSYSTSTINRMRLQKTTDNSNCERIDNEWDVTSIPDGSTVTDTQLRWGTYSITSGRNCTFNSMENQPSTRTAAERWTDAGDGTAFVSNDATCLTVSSTLDLGTSADSDVEANLASDWWGVGIKFHDESRDTNRHKFDTFSQEYEIEITYTSGSTSYTRNVTDELGLDESAGVMVGIVISITDELGLDDSVQVQAGQVISITDELGLDDTAQVMQDSVRNITDELGLDDSVVVVSALTIPVMDELGLDDSVEVVISAIYIEDELGLDDSVEVTVTEQIFNAIKLYLNAPTASRLGGVFAQSCPGGEYVSGIDTTGTIICTALPP